MTTPLSRAEADWMDRSMSLDEIAAGRPARRSAVVEYGRMRWTVRGQYAAGRFDLTVAEVGESIDDIAEFLAEDVIADLTALALDAIEQEDADEQDEEGICPGCAGSGEGFCDGTLCFACQGRGTR